MVTGESYVWKFDNAFCGGSKVPERAFGPEAMNATFDELTTIPPPLQNHHKFNLMSVFVNKCYSILYLLWQTLTPITKEVILFPDDFPTFFQGTCYNL